MLLCFHAPTPTALASSPRSTSLLPLPTKNYSSLHASRRNRARRKTRLFPPTNPATDIRRNPVAGVVSDGFLRSEGGWDRGGGRREEKLRRMPHHLHAHVARRTDRPQVSVQRLRHPVPEEEEARPWPRSEGAAAAAST